MAFDVQGALKAGYSSDEINHYLQTKSSNPVTGFFQGASNLARKVGLGIIPDTLAPLYMGGQEIAQGRNPTPYGGNQATSQQLAQNAQSNPFGNQENLQQEGGSPTDIAAQTGKDAAQAGSWTLPYGKGGILARLGIGAAGGALNSVGDNPRDAATKIATGAGLNAISPVLGIFGKSNPGKKINSIIDAHDASPDTGSKIMQALQNHFGTAANPNLDLLPNAPAQETGNLKKLLQKEITSAQAGDLDPSPTLRNIQQWKSGAGSQGKFNNNTTSATNKLFQNISKAYGNVMKEVAPEIAKPYAQYAKQFEPGGTKTGIAGAIAAAQRNPILKTIEGLSTGYVGYRGLTHLFEAPLRTAQNITGSNWAGPQGGNNGW